jgi:CRISPR-associated protein Cas5d
MSANGGVSVAVWGDFACFTRPEMKVERVSYDVMTPSAARGILEVILWKPAIRWQVERIEVHRPIRWTTIRRNEVGAVFSARNAGTAMRRGEGNLGLYVEEHRQQRAALVLRDVAYTIHARFRYTEAKGPRDNDGKFLDMFRRRVEGGKCFNQPYLGCREFSAFFGPELPKDFTGEGLGETSDLGFGSPRDLGWMLHDIDFSMTPPEPRFFRAQLQDGSIEVPPFDSEEVAR